MENKYKRLKTLLWRSMNGCTCPITASARNRCSPSTVRCKGRHARIYDDYKKYGFYFIPKKRCPHKFGKIQCFREENHRGRHYICVHGGKIHRAWRTEDKPAGRLIEPENIREWLGPRHTCKHMVKTKR